MSEFIAVDPDDPNRCQGTMVQGQCTNLAIPGQKMCPVHSRPGPSANGTAIRNFRLKQFQGRVGEFADSPEIKSLREEIGITRLVLEETINACQGPNDLLLSAGKIIDIVTRLDKLITSCHRIEKSSGTLLDRNACMMLCDRIVAIIGEHVDDPDALLTIGNEVAKAIMSIQVVAALDEK